MRLAATVRLALRSNALSTVQSVRQKPDGDSARGSIHPARDAAQSRVPTSLDLAVVGGAEAPIAGGKMASAAQLERIRRGLVPLMS